MRQKGTRIEFRLRQLDVCVSCLPVNDRRIRFCVVFQGYPGVSQDAFMVSATSGKGAIMNTDIICQWRDAITDPPPFLWQGLAMDADDKISFVMRRSDDYINYIGMLALPSKWLDITDIPAVAVSKVQAAVDSIKTGLAKCGCGHGECLTCYLRMDHGEVIDDVVSDTLGRIRHFTGVTPTEVK